MSHKVHLDIEHEEIKKANKPIIIRNKILSLFLKCQYPGFCFLIIGIRVDSIVVKINEFNPDLKQKENELNPGSELLRF